MNKIELINLLNNKNSIYCVLKERIFVKTNKHNTSFPKTEENMKLMEKIHPAIGLQFK